MCILKRLAKHLEAKSVIKFFLLQHAQCHTFKFINTASKFSDTQNTKSKEIMLAESETIVQYIRSAILIVQSS